MRAAQERERRRVRTSPAFVLRSDTQHSDWEHYEADLIIGRAVSKNEARTESPMRVFEFHAEELIDANYRVMIVDLDSIVRFQETASEYDQAHLSRIVTLTDGGGLSMTKSAFDRIVAAWRSK
jgi:hypothetical protein